MVICCPAAEMEAYSKKVGADLINDDANCDRTAVLTTEETARQEISGEDAPSSTSNSVINSKYTRGNNVLSGLTHECGVFGAIACGDWPTSVNNPLSRCCSSNVLNKSTLPLSRSMWPR